MKIFRLRISVEVWRLRASEICYDLFLDFFEKDKLMWRHMHTESMSSSPDTEDQIKCTKYLERSITYLILLTLKSYPDFYDGKKLKRLGIN